MSQKKYYVYIRARKNHGTLYVEVTGYLFASIYSHRNNLVDGSTKKYNVHKLVYFEIHEDAEEATLKEKRIKKWNRDWKINLIEQNNPYWQDLYAELI